MPGDPPGAGRRSLGENQAKINASMRAGAAASSLAAVPAGAVPRRRFAGRADRAGVGRRGGVGRGSRHRPVMVVAAVAVAWLPCAVPCAADRRIRTPYRTPQTGMPPVAGAVRRAVSRPAGRVPPLHEPAPRPRAGVSPPRAGCARRRSPRPAAGAARRARPATPTGLRTARAPGRDRPPRAPATSRPSHAAERRIGLGVPGSMVSTCCQAARACVTRDCASAQRASAAQPWASPLERAFDRSCQVSMTERPSTTFSTSDRGSVTCPGPVSMVIVRSVSLDDDPADAAAPAKLDLVRLRQRSRSERQPARQQGQTT